VVQDKKLLEVHVEKGMQHGQKITFTGEADEAVCSFQCLMLFVMVHTVVSDYFTCVINLSCWKELLN
jgi:DnaJ-class molecular chaperone